MYLLALAVGMVGATCTEAPCEANDRVVEAARGQTGNVACDMYHTYEEDVAKVSIRAGEREGDVREGFCSADASRGRPGQATPTPHRGAVLANRTWTGYSELGWKRVEA